MNYRGWTVLPVFLLLLTGCGNLLPKARDITTVELMQVLALDEGENDKLRVTAATGVRAEGQGGEPKPPVLLHEEGETVLSACMAMQSGGDGYASFSHVEQVLLGEQVAERPVEGLLDFVERNPEMRLDTYLYIVKGEAAGTVEAFQEEERSAAELLQGISRELEGKESAWPVSVREVLLDLEENGCALVPVLEVEKEEDKPVLRCERMGVLQEGRYRKSLTVKQSKAAALLTGKLGTGAEEVQLPDGTLTGLRLTDSSCSWKPQWKGEKLVGLTAHVKVKADLAELRSGGYAGEKRNQLERELKTVLKQILSGVLRECQAAGGDYLHLQRALRMSCPARYWDIDEHWAEWFPELQTDAEVLCTVERGQDLKD